MPTKTIFLLDAYALAYRSYYAFIKNPRINSKGENTSAVFGFTNTLLEIISKQSPDALGVVFDPHGPTFRHKIYPEYKANREAMPEDMRKSIPYIKQIIEAMNIPVVEVSGFEADDVIGTLANRFAEKDFQVFMMTPDKDYAQLVKENIFVYKPSRSGNQPEIWDKQKVLEKFKVTPNKIIDLLGLMGDSSDNIPGCPGVGPKGAELLINKFKNIDGIYENIEQLKGKQKENLIEFKKQVLLSKELATIDTNVPFELNVSNFELKKPNEQKLNDLFEQLEFKNLINRVLKRTEKTKPLAKKTLPIQGSLFDSPQQITEVSEELLQKFDENSSDYLLISNINEAEKLLQKLLQEKTVCFDTETTSLEIHKAKLLGIAFSFGENKAYYVNTNQDTKIIDVFKPFFENENIVKVGQNIKYDILVLKNYGIQVCGTYFDTLIAHYLIQPELRHNLDALAKHYFNYQTITTEELIGKKGKNQLNMSQVPIELLKNYACEDADITYRLATPLKKELEKYELSKVFESIEIPLINVLANMEYEGVKIDALYLNDYAKELKLEIYELEKEIYEIAKMEFNISSPKQLGEVLFEHLKIVEKPKKTKTKQYSTSEDVLSKIADKHPIIHLILEYRSVKKLLSTYVEALPLLINSKTGKIHTSYNQAVTSTGRLSSNNPNLQNIPIRDKRGQRMRKAFVPSDENHILLAADYSQIELRIMAHFSQDAGMIEAFKNEEDIHTATAARIFKTEIKNVNSEMRRKAKAANFGIIYGISSFGLAQNLNISRTEAKKIIDSYFDSYPEVKKFMSKSVELVREKGYAETFFGRRRYLNTITSENAILRSAAERNAINAPIQGTAADIIKIAMINIQKQLEKQNLKSKMILQVHDELVFDVQKSELEKVKNLVKSEMENAAKLNVPLTVDMGTGANWLEAH